MTVSSEFQDQFADTYGHGIKQESIEELNQE